MPRLDFIQKKTATVLLLSLLIVAVAVSSTVAYIIVTDHSRENVFNPVTVETAPLYGADGGVAVKNNGDISAYIRVAITVSYVSVDENGDATGSISSEPPKEGVDYTLDFSTVGNWVKGTDGFWYYKVPVLAGGTTENLITSITRLNEPPTGYSLSVKVVTTGIQSEPIGAVEQAFGVTVNGNTVTPG